jgi:uncharacterized repeat protein (TIGR03803 family)
LVVAAQLVGGLLVAGTALAQSYRILEDFEAQTSYRAGLLAGSDGRLYGTSFTGGPSGGGTVFAIDASGTPYTILHDFPNTTDAFPAAPLIQTADGSFYGTTSGFGSHGSVFRIDPAGVFTVLHSFSGFADGDGPFAALTRADDGMLYGATMTTIFRIAPDGTGFTVLSNNGAPSGLIQASDGRLYGATFGAVFRLDLSGSNYEVVHAFPTSDWMSSLIEVSGVLYGTDPAGGASGQGFVYRLDLDGGNFQVLHDFAGPDGTVPMAALSLASDGLLYGTASAGGASGFGNVYSIDPGGAPFAVVHEFSGLDGGIPQAPPTEWNGWLYGTTSGITGGVVYRMSIAPSGSGFEILHAVPLGSNPAGGLARDSSGGFYGTTSGGGMMGAGTVFKLDATGANPAETLHTFVGSDGRWSAAPLLLLDGNLYGSAWSGGADQRGVLFELSAAGTGFLVTHSFDGHDGNGPAGILVAAMDGSLYGATFTGEFDAGSVFRIDPGGANFATVRHFALGDGDNPSALMQASDGFLYGATRAGGPVPFDSEIFRLDTAGTVLADVHDLDPTEGSNIAGSLIEGSDGLLYGAAWSGGTGTGCDLSAPGCGTIFKLAKSGASFSKIHDFSGGSGVRPSAGLLQASDGFLYGTTSATACESAGGTIYRVQTDGSGYTVLHRFTGADGSSPAGALIEGADGALYGTATAGGPRSGGVAFRLDLSTAFAVSALSPSSGPAVGGTPISLPGIGYQDGLALTIGGIPALDVVVNDPANLSATSPALSPGTLNHVLVTNPDGTIATFPEAWLADFLDVPQGNLFHDFVGSLFRAAVTAGCGAGTYCPDAAVTRAQMAVFLLKATDSSCFVPEYCTGTFQDVSCSPVHAFAVDWIEELYRRSITGGCSTDPLLYCPDSPVTRAQMAVFLLKSEHGSAYVPPSCTGIFDDVSCPGLFADWIEQLAAENVTGGCQVDPPLYCPASPVTRAQMAAFLVKTFGLQP